MPFDVIFPIAAKINSLFIQLLILLYTGSLNKESDILWIYWTKAYLFAKKTKMQGRIFFDIDHNIIDDVNTENKKKLEEILTDIGNRAERILSGSRSMIEWYEKRDYHNNIYLRNGVDSERFDKLYNTPPEMANINKPRILYVGTLSKWINSDLLINLIKRNKKWNFIFLGNNYKSNISVLLGKQANVTMLGHKNAEEVPAYMTNSDIALGMYKNEKWLDVDSMKFYEYIASGLAVISTKYHQYIEEDFNKLVETYDGINDIENAINIQIQLNGSQKEIRLNKASNFISKNTWDNRIKHIIQYF